MNIFQKKSTKPKKLSFREMWEIHKIIDTDELMPTVASQSSVILDRISTEDFRSILKKFYGKYLISNPLEAGLFFIRAITANKFFEFRVFIGNIDGRAK